MPNKVRFERGRSTKKVEAPGARCANAASAAAAGTCTQTSCAATAGVRKSSEMYAVSSVIHESFPGIPVNESLSVVFNTPEDATIWERSRDLVLRFFARYHVLFTGLAFIMVVVFIVNLCVLIFAFWGERASSMQIRNSSMSRFRLSY